jgi:hypothetical protein
MISSEQPQEWTPETVKDLIIPGLDLGEADANYIACKTVADAHNAALADEREMANQRVGEQVRASYEISKQLREQLDAEREKRDEMLLAIVTAKIDLVKIKQELAAEKQATANAFSKGYDQGHADALAAERERNKAQASLKLTSPP